MIPFPLTSTVTNGSVQAQRRLSGLPDPFPWTDPSLSGPGSGLFTCLSAPPPGRGWRRGGTGPPPAALGSNGPITGAAKTSVRGLVHSAQTVVRLPRERSAYPPGLRNVDYGCFDGQRNLDHTTEWLRGGFNPRLTGGGGVWRPPRIFAIAQKRTALSTWNLAGLLIRQFDIVRDFFFWNPSEICWDMVDFVTSLHATFGRKLAKLRGSVEDAVFNENANGKHQKT